MESDGHTENSYDVKAKAAPNRSSRRLAPGHDDGHRPPTSGSTMPIAVITRVDGLGDALEIYFIIGGKCRAGSEASPCALQDFILDALKWEYSMSYELCGCIYGFVTDGVSRRRYRATLSRRVIGDVIEARYRAMISRR